MIVVAGHLVVDPSGLAAYPADCEQVLGLAPTTRGFLDFAVVTDLFDAPSGEHKDAIRDACPRNPTWQTRVTPRIGA